MEKDNTETLYYFMNNSHHNLISCIDGKYGLFDFSTCRWTEERWETIDEAIEGCKKYYKTLHEFKTYRELFEHCLKSELEYDIFDMYGDKNLIERESLHDGKVGGIQEKMGLI